jgi:TRAP-type C4-dicarboxylate transport system substrate-binding protein
MGAMNRLLVIVGLVVGLARGAAAESREIRMATVAPAGSPWMELLEHAAGEIADKTEKRVTIKYFPGGQQGDERDFIRKIKLGQLDGAALTAIGLAQIEPSILVLQLPMLFTSREELDYAADKMWPYFQKKFEKKGYRLAERGEIGWIYFFSKNKVSSMEDLRKQKLWILNDDLGTSMLDKLKIQGVPLGLPEVDAALTSGRINACFSSPLGAVALQWYTKVKYMSSTPMVFAIGATVISLDAVKNVSATDQKSIEAIAKRSSKKARTVIRQADDDARKALVRKGITVVDPSKDMVDELTAMASAVQGEMTGKVFSKEELEMVIGYRDDYRKSHAKK